MTQYVCEKEPGENLFVVGHYDPKGRWHTESDHNNREEAAKRVHYLNGGSQLSGAGWTPGPPVTSP